MHQINSLGPGNNSQLHEESSVLVVSSTSKRLSLGRRNKLAHARWLDSGPLARALRLSKLHPCLPYMEGLAWLGQFS